MKKKRILILCIIALICILAGGCGSSGSQTSSGSADEAGNSAQEENSSDSDMEHTENENAADDGAELGGSSLEDGTYTVDFDTDNSMFHVNEALDGKGTLTVENGRMTVHVSLTSKNIVNLFPGLAKDAEEDGTEILNPTVDTVTYSDGITEEVYGFDVPVPVLDGEFDLALLGTKGKWYDHKVIVSNPVKTEETEGLNETAAMDMEDGEYEAEVTLEGGSGKASISSPAVIIVKNKKAYARIEWSSPNYDYMKIGDETYYPVNEDGNSTFEIPVGSFDEKMAVIADTTAMGTPHEIEYSITFHLITE